MNILTALKTHLVNEGITTPIKLNRAPDSPDVLIVLRDTGGLEPDANDTTIRARQHKTFQVYIRGTSYADTIIICDAVRDALIGRIGLAVDTVVFENLLLLNEFQSIGADGVGRYEFTANFETKVLDTDGSGYYVGDAVPLNVISLGDLADVTTGTPLAGQVLVYSNGQWRAGDANDAGDRHYSTTINDVLSATIAHNLGKRPAVTIIDTANDEVFADIEHINNNEITVSFSAPFTGAIICN